jgi:hypothetical protein
VGDEIEHDHVLHESLHHNEHRQHPSRVAVRQFVPEISTARNLSTYEMQEVYQTEIRVVTAHMVDSGLRCAVLYRIVWSKTNRGGSRSVRLLSRSVRRKGALR